MTTEQMIARLIVAMIANDTAAMDNLITALEDLMPADELIVLLAQLRAQIVPAIGRFAGYMLPVKAA